MKLVLNDLLLAHHWLCGPGALHSTAVSCSQPAGLKKHSLMSGLLQAAVLMAHRSSRAMSQPSATDAQAQSPPNPLAHWREFASAR